MSRDGGHYIAEAISAKLRGAQYKGSGTAIGRGNFGFIFEVTE